MSIVGLRQSSLPFRGLVEGWVISLSLHALAIVAAVALARQVQLAPQPEPFTWDVTLASTEAPAPTPPPAATSPVPARTPPAPTSRPDSSPAKVEVPEPVAQQRLMVQANPQRLPTPEIVEPRLIEPAAAVRQPAPIIQEQVTAQERQVQQHVEASAFTPVERALPVIEHRIQQRAAPVMTDAPSPVSSARATAQSQEPVQRAAPIASSPVKASGSAPTAPETLVGPAPQSVTETPVTQEPLAARQVESPQPLTPATVSALEPTSPPSPSAPAPSTAQAQQAPPQTAALTPPTLHPSRPDYGWLSETILRRVEQLKKYPAEARMDRAEGKVVVKALVREDGSLADAEIVRSSGYPSLDRAALELMQQASPIPLPRQLGKARIAIQIPLSYKLDR